MTIEPPCASVALNGVRKSFGSLDVIHGIDLAIDEGEFVIFVGPSGCGKSTLLRMIAGLEEVTDGEIAIKGRDVTDLDPSDRGIAMVFQSYALYPHMSVRDNLAFGLKMSRTDAAEIDRRVSQASAILKIAHLLDRRPGQLSGGQRQRVRSDGRSCESQTSFSSTSRFPTLMPSCVFPCASRSRGSTGNWGTR